MQSARPGQSSRCRLREVPGDIRPVIGQTVAVRRTLAGLLFGVAYLCATFALSGWMLQRTAFDPDQTASAAPAVLQDRGIKDELVNLVADATAKELNLEPATVRAQVRSILSTKQGAELMAEILHDAHAHLIGQQSEPVQITGPQMVQVVRDERAALLPAITLPVPRVAVFDWMRTILKWLVPIAALAAVLFALVGLTAHPERSAFIRSLGFGLLILAALFGVLGFIVPRFVLPLLSSSPWANVPVRLAEDSLPLLIGIELLLVGGGLALLAGSGVMRRRRRWSAPISTHRYNEGRQWT